MDRARPSTRPCAFRAITSGVCDRAISVLQWPASTHTAIGDLFIRLKGVQTAVVASGTTPRRADAFRLRVGCRASVEAHCCLGQCPPAPQSVPPLGNCAQGARVVVHFKLFGGGYRRDQQRPRSCHGHRPRHRASPTLDVLPRVSHSRRSSSSDSTSFLPRSSARAGCQATGRLGSRCCASASSPPSPSAPLVSHPCGSRPMHSECASSLETSIVT